MTETIIELAASTGSNAYALVDCAHDPYLLPGTVEALSPDAECLFRGKAREELGDETAWIAPICAPGEDGSSIVPTRLAGWVDDAWGEDFIALAISSLPAARFGTHMRKFTKVSMPDGTEAFFRVYSPDVLRTYLPTFSRKQIEQLAGGIDALAVPARGRAAGIQLFDLAGTAADGSVSVEFIDTDTSEPFLNDA